MEMRSTGAVETGLGFAGTREEVLAIWAEMATRWSTKTRWRPTAGDVAVYRELAGEKLRGEVLILGVTPELRDLAAEADAQVTVVDLSAAMHDAMSAFLHRADPAEETWVESDWCEANLPAGTFDIVLGDLIWWAVSVANQYTLRDTIHRALRPDGSFIGRLRCTDPRRSAEDPVPVAESYLEQLDRSPAEARRIEKELLSWVYDHTADHAHKRLDRARASRVLHALADDPRCHRHAEFLRATGSWRVAADWTSQTRRELLDLLGARFSAVAEGRAGDYDALQYPIIAWRPR